MTFFERTMRNAAAILFWAAILLFVGGIATHLLVDGGLEPQGSSGSIIDPRSFVYAIYLGLGAAVWPFLGAALIWTLQRDGKGDEQ